MRRLIVLDNLGNNAEITAGGILTKAEIREIVDDIFTEFVNFLVPVTIKKTVAFDYANQNAPDEIVTTANCIVTGINKSEDSANDNQNDGRKIYAKFRQLGFIPEPVSTIVSFEGKDYRVTDSRNPGNADAVVIFEVVSQ